MTREQREAHVRMVESLPKHTHYAPTREAQYPEGARVKRAVIVQGERYESIASAAKALGKRRQDISYMIRKGTAKYA